MATFLTVKEVAAMLRVSERTILNYINRGQLSAVRLGERAYRIQEADVDAFVAGQRTTHKPHE